MCPENSIAVNNTCKCSESSYQVAIKDDLPICLLCPSASKANQADLTCICDGIFIYDSLSNTCVECPANSSVFNNTCVCSSSSYKLSTQDDSFSCFSCPQDSTPNQLTQTCNCPANSIYDQKSNSCIQCLPNSISKENVCVCSAYSHQISTLNDLPVCITCENSVFNEETQQCACDFSSIWFGNECVQCPENFVPSEERNNCVECPTGTAAVNGVCSCAEGVFNGVECVKCPQESRFEQNKCVCDDSKLHIENGECVLCNQGQFEFRDECVSKCPAGFIIYENTCQQINQKSSSWIYAVIFIALFALIITATIVALLIKRRMQKRTTKKTNTAGRETMYYARRLHQDQSKSSSSSLIKSSSQVSLGKSDSTSSLRKKMITKPLQEQQKVIRPVKRSITKMLEGTDSSNSSMASYTSSLVDGNSLKASGSSQ
ncbi:Conserved_hypothetical protein [Hexamita inflata]|uniref:Uncharacterized protein n=2 Tax=Hexamita inflata TaxID=28002 RepID=A0ABP1JFU3_9EUKA